MIDPMNATQTNTPQQPEISTPSGGGAIHGINEQFQSGGFNGAADFSVPFPLTAARGLEPSIVVSYNSGAGNGICGMGVGLGQLGITRKTSNGIPKYNETDIFLLGGAELVPKLAFDTSTAQWLPVIRMAANWKITDYRPRTEGAFNLIEHWQDTEGDDSYWIITASGNKQVVYGRSASARIADPAQPRRIFSWHPETETDATGNIIQYNYEQDKRDNNTYLKSIAYGNYVADDATCFAFTIVIDYGTFDPVKPGTMPSGFIERADPFSMFISGFEIRTSRLVYHILQYHQFTDQYGGQPFLVKSMKLDYGDTANSDGSVPSLSGLSFLRNVFVTGYQIQSDMTYRVKTMPPVTLSYTGFVPEGKRYQLLKVADGAAIPGYLSPEAYQMVDLNNDGLPGLLYSNGLTSFYYEPLGEGAYRSPVALEGFPADRDLGTGQNVLMSLSGNGIKELVVEMEGRSGYYKNTEPGVWNGFEPFEMQPTEAFAAGNQWVDLTGDGLADLVLFEQDAIKYYPSLHTQGYGPARRAVFSDGFPAASNNSEEELLTFAAMLGDGLQHYVRIRNGHVACWPNMGYGHFGAVRYLKNAPRIDGAMDMRRLRLADIDGSGTADIIYFEHDYAKVWFNQSGNGFSDPIEIPLPVSYDQLSQVSFADVNGTGTTCMIITVTEPEVQHYYYDFAGGEKPYLLHTTNNNIGASAKYNYTTSVKQYLRDKRNGRPWPTRLFFPVHVVEHIETMDEPSGALHLQRFAYHDGYYDPVERSFRGFGYTETWDTDHFQVYAANAANKGFPVSTVNKELHTPPVLTKSWYHTGTYTEAGRAAAFYQEEYFSGDPAFYSISGQVLDKAITTADAETLRQAYAAMEGQLLRQEVYGLDGSPEMQYPYTVSETEIYIRLEQPREQQRYAVFLPYVRQSMSWQYERNPTDPRVTHNFSLLINEWGAVTHNCNVYYPRRTGQGNFIFEEQQQLKITLGCSSFTAATDPGNYYINVPYENRNYEIAGISLPAGSAYFPFNTIAEGIYEALQDVLNYNVPFSANTPTPQARLYQWTQQYYWDDNQEKVLSLGAIGRPVLAHHRESAIYPETTFNSFYNGLLTSSDLSAATGYITHDSYYWNAGLSQYYLPADGYYLPTRQQNDFAPEGNLSLQPVSTTGYDTYYLRAIATTETLTGTDGITAAAEIDYRTMQPWRVTDPNQNVSEVLFDPLGYVIVSTNYGTVAGKQVGNQSVSSYNILPATAAVVITQPQQYLQQAGSYFYYDLFAWMDRKEPVCAIALQGELYTSQLRNDQVNQVKTGIVFSDGFGRSLVSKTNTTPGSTGVHDRDGNWVYVSRKGANDWSDDRWICSGRTVYNNKGKATQQFQPYFSDGWQYDQAGALIDAHQLVPPSVLHYDALSRVIRTDDPKGFFTKVTFTPWQSKQYDANDTILDAPYYLQHKEQLGKIKSTAPISGAHLPGTEVAAIRQAVACYNSPAATILDTMGRSVRSVTDRLGAVTARKLMPILQDATAVQTAIEELITAGWLVADTGNPDVYWLTDTFQPYTIGFAVAFTIGGTDAVALLDLLKQGRLTTLQTFDIQGRLLQSVDPRLLWSDLTAATSYFNFRYEYDMAGGLLKTISADAGQRTQLLNMFSGILYVWDARGFCIETIYDQLQRKIQTVVSGGDGAVTAAHTTGMTIFGEYASGAADNNLVGQPWKVFDDAGAVVVGLYGIAGQVLAQERYFRKDYKISADWTNDAQAEVLKNQAFKQLSDHNALGLPIRGVNPDDSIYLPVYNEAGQLSQLDMIFASGTDKQPTTLVKSVVYDPNGNAVYLEYGNGTATRTTIEATTQRIINQRSYRIGDPQKGADLRLQEIHYTYDPVGNITARRDNSWQHVFNENQQVQPLSQYEYDLVYQLIQATGRQKKQSSESSGSAQQFMRDHGIPLRWASPNDQQALENYTQQYTYDDAGNLTRLKQNAGAQHSIAYTVAEDSNRLTAAQNPISYDANGNIQQLDHLSSITWNYRNQLVEAVAIARKNAESDAEYYQYDSAGNRVRKVTERLMFGGTQKEIEEKYYLGPYQYKRISQVAVKDDEDVAPVVLLEKQSLKISGPAGLCCISHYWTCDVSGRETKSFKRIYRYQYSDVINSVGLETNNEGELLSYEEYYPYGGTSFTVAAKALEVGMKEYRYSGQEQDRFTGLYYYGMRYYPPWLCRWINTDPAGTVDGLNLYAFVRGNPVTHRDIGGMVIETFKYLGKTYKKPPKNNEIEARAHALGQLIAKEAQAEGAGFATQILKIATSKDVASEGGDNLLDDNNALQSDSRFDTAYSDALKSESSKATDSYNSSAATNYRLTHDAQDEHVSTSVICSMIRGVASAGQLSDSVHTEIKEAFRYVSRFRFATADTGVKTVDGTMQHPTSEPIAVYGEGQKEGKREHTYWNRQRAHLALAAGENSTETGISRLLAMAKEAMRYTLTSAYARPTASNVIPRSIFTKAALLGKSQSRERGKLLFHELNNNGSPLPKRKKGEDTAMADEYHFSYDSYNVPSPLYDFSN
jgi:RHS repeat-associated protein